METYSWQPTEHLQVLEFHLIVLNYWFSLTHVPFVSFQAAPKIYQSLWEVNKLTFRSMERFRYRHDSRYQRGAEPPSRSVQWTCFMNSSVWKTDVYLKTLLSVTTPSCRMVHVDRGMFMAFFRGYFCQYFYYSTVSFHLLVCLLNRTIAKIACIIFQLYYALDLVIAFNSYSSKVIDVFICLFNYFVYFFYINVYLHDGMYIYIRHNAKLVI